MQVLYGEFRASVLFKWVVCWASKGDQGRVEDMQGLLLKEDQLDGQS